MAERLHDVLDLAAYVRIEHVLRDLPEERLVLGRLARSIGLLLHVSVLGPQELFQSGDLGLGVIRMVTVIRVPEERAAADHSAPGGRDSQGCGLPVVRNSLGPRPEVLGHHISVKDCFPRGCPFGASSTLGSKSSTTRLAPSLWESFCPSLPTVTAAHNQRLFLRLSAFVPAAFL